MGEILAALREGFVGAFKDARTVLGWFASWALFAAGDMVSRIFLRHEATPFMYPVYNSLMWWSTVAQDWGGAGPWDEKQ